MCKCGGRTRMWEAVRDGVVVAWGFECKACGRRWTKWGA